MMLRMEMKKLLCHPMLWCLVLVFLAFNIFLIKINLGENKAELHEMHEIIAQGQMDEAYRKDTLTLYDDLDMNIIKATKEELTGAQFHGSLKKFVDRCYENLNKRVSEIKQSGESAQITYPGQIYRLHNVLYHKIFKKVLIEMFLIMAMSILFLMDYERIQKNEDIVYATRQGRRVQCTKFLAGLFTGGIFCIALMAATLLLYFSQVSYGGLWNVSISAAMAAEPRGVLMYPFITFYKMTFLQYLLASAAMGMVLAVIMGALMAAVQILIRNSYLSALFIILLFMGCMALAQINTQSWFDVICSLNPAISWIHCGAWFMENELWGSFPAYDILSIGVQGVVIGALGRLGYKRFLKKDIL